MGRLSGKVALITGAARGIGAANARMCIGEGAKVVLTDIRDSEGQDIADELGDAAQYLHHDVTQSADWDRVIAETESLFGPISVLVNNAGIAEQMATMEQTTEEFYHRMIAANQTSVFLGMKNVLPSMRKADGGLIINISSTGGLVAGRGVFAYIASKFAVRGMSKAAAVELARENIRVYSVHPGSIKTPMMGDVSQQFLDVLNSKIPMGRVGQPDEVASLVVFLSGGVPLWWCSSLVVFLAGGVPRWWCSSLVVFLAGGVPRWWCSSLVVFLASDEASFCTGAEYVADGGFTSEG